MMGKFRATLFVGVDQKSLTYFFVDDSLLFCHAKLEEVNTIQSILKVYVKAFGLQIKNDKTVLFFGKSVSEST